MKINRFRDKHMRGALQQLRDALGPDAVILSNRRTAEGVEVKPAADRGPGVVGAHGAVVGEAATVAELQVAGVMDLDDEAAGDVAADAGPAGGTGAEANIPAFPWTTTPSEMLLKYDDPLELCLSCHDNIAGVPDVVGVDVNALTERSAGYFDGPLVTNPRGHNLGHDLEQGYVAEFCGRCHFGGDITTASVTCSVANHGRRWSSSSVGWCMRS